MQIYITLLIVLFFTAKHIVCCDNKLQPVYTDLVEFENCIKKVPFAELAKKYAGYRNVEVVVSRIDISLIKWDKFPEHTIIFEVSRNQSPNQVNDDYEDIKNLYNDQGSIGLTLLAQLIAYQKGVDKFGSTFTNHLEDSLSTNKWHTEFTIGTNKVLYEHSDLHDEDIKNLVNQGGISAMINLMDAINTAHLNP